jgi:hypothetical protein
LKEFEDEIDEKSFQIFKNKRLQELKEQALKNKFGNVTDLRAIDWKTEVTEAKDTWIIIHLFAQG